MDNNNLPPLEWHAERRQVKELKNWSENPRKISKKAFLKLKERIVQRGFHDVIKVDTEDTVLSGNQRRKALLDLKIDKVTVLVPNRPLTLEEKEKVAVESNLLDGSWSIPKINNLSIDLRELDWSGSITNLLSKDLEVKNDNFDEIAELKKVRKTNIKPGDMFTLGKHRLVCENSENPEVVKKLVGENRVDFVDCDLPYNINLSYNSGVGARKGKYGGSINDSKTDEEYQKFVETIMQNAIAVSKPDCHYLFWTDERYVWLFQMAYKHFGVDSKRLLVWIKNNATVTPGIAFGKATEFCVYGTRGRAFLNNTINDLTEIANKEVEVGNKSFEQIDKILNILMVKRLPSTQYLHPTQKSPDLHQKALLRCTRQNDVVLDLTAGSGSILSACHQLGRIAYMSEIDPVFCQLILNRYKKLTGDTPKLIK